MTKTQIKAQFAAEKKALIALGKAELAARFEAKTGEPVSVLGGNLSASWLACWLMNNA